MILERVKRAAGEKVRRWAEARGLAASPAAFIPPPAHVSADLSLPWPLAAAKQLRRPPMELAAELAAVLAGEADVEPPRAVPPGYVNFRLKASALAENLTAILEKPSAYGFDPAKPKRSILVEFVSANPTGPLHLASGRGATLGDSLVRILRRIGHKAGAEYYVNDGGGRVELLGLSVKARWEELQGKAAQMPDNGYRGEYLKDIAASAPADAAGWDAATFGRFAMEKLLAQHQEDMARFGVGFDRWFRESELYEQGKVQSTLQFLESKGMTYSHEGAVFLRTSSFSGKNLKAEGIMGIEAVDDKDRVLVKSDGTPTYFLPDIAYHKDKHDRGWEELIDIWGADHHGYVPRMKAAIAALGKAPGSFHAIIHQLVHLVRGTQAVKMSKRAGEFVTLRELVEEVGVDACRFFFAQRTANVQMNFDLELAVKRSQENPVYYAQYVHARVCSIFKEGAKAGLSPVCAEAQKTQCLALTLEEERALLVKLAWFPEVLAACERDLSPHHLANYLLELAGLFHPFYERCRVVDSGDKDRSQARLALCGGVRAVITQGLDLLGVSAPERM